MISEAFASALIIMIFVWPAFVLPVLLGPIILIAFRHDELSRPAGWFTLKPLLATLLWGMLLAIINTLSLPIRMAGLLTLAPGVGLTLLILLGARRLWASDARSLLLFLVLDALRWVNSLIFVLTSGDSSIDNPGWLYFPGVLLPNLFAIVALVILWVRQRQRNRIAQQSLARLEG